MCSPELKAAQPGVRSDESECRAFILGGSATTLAFVSSFRAESAKHAVVVTRLVPLAQTPIGVVVGDTWQSVTVASASLLDWVDQTFPSDDEHAFVAPAREIELLARVRWHAPMPEKLNEGTVVNIEDVPEDVAEALLHDAEPIVQCAACRRLCVRDHFVWKERQLCAWDYHQTVFGKRGPWHGGPYENRHFETLPTAAYVAPALAADAGADVILAVGGIDDAVAREAINALLSADAQRAHMAVRTPDGYTLLRESDGREQQSAP